MEKKTFKAEHGKTRVGKMLQDMAAAGKKIAPGLLDIAGNITGIDALEKLSDAISGDSNISAEDTALMRELINRDIEDMKADAQVRVAHLELEKAQVQSEDNLTRRARPIRMYFWLLMFTNNYLVWPWVYAGEQLFLPDEMLILIFSDFGLYNILRSAFDKPGKSPKEAISQLRSSLKFGSKN